MKNLVISVFLLFFIVLSCTNRDGEIIDLINSVKKQNDDLKAQITSLKKTTDSAMVAITRVTVSQAVTDKKLDAIQTELKSVLAQISSLSTQMTAANADLAIIKAKIDALQVKCAELVAQIGALTTTLNSTLADLKKQVASLKNTSDSALAVIAKLSAAQATSDKNIVSIQAELKNVLSQIVDLSSQLVASNVDITSLKAKIDALQVKVNELVAQLDGLLSSINTITVSHLISNGVAPINVKVTYGIYVSNASGTPKKWITQNLGALREASSANEKSASSSGWYFQFNRKQGFISDESLRTPNSIWINNIQEDSDWELSNDPCKLELGDQWHLPTIKDWSDERDSWNGEAFLSKMKISSSAYLSSDGGSLNQWGISGNYWSKSQNSPSTAWYLGGGGPLYYNRLDVKTFAFPCRCVSY